MIRQRVAAARTRTDGCDGRGIPADCLRAAVASLIGWPWQAVPHFALYPVWWWDVLRVWARSYGADFACVAPVGGDITRWLVDPADPGWSGLMVGVGPSRVSGRRHAVVVDRTLELVHDPNPAGRGLIWVDEVYVSVPPYEHPDLPLAPLTLLGA